MRKGDKICLQVLAGKEFLELQRQRESFQGQLVYLPQKLGEDAKRKDCFLRRFLGNQKSTVNSKSEEEGDEKCT